MLRPALVLLAALLPTVIAARSPVVRGKVDFDYFLLVRQWPASFCNEHSCTHRPPGRYAFTVHGLWPQRRDGTWPEFCDPGSQLNVDELDDLLPELEKVWPSWSSDDASFWGHEWSRHGTCAAALLGGQHAFFWDVLQLHSKLNIQRALSAADITPSNSRRYPVADIKDAIDKAYGVLPHITCDGEGELAEVWMCVDKKLRPIDCTFGPRSNGDGMALPARTQLGTGAAGPRAAANNYCSRVLIPKLRQRAAEAVAVV